MRVIGIDIGKVSFKAVWLENQQGKWQIRETFWQVHQQEIKKIWQKLKNQWHIKKQDQIIVTGRLRQMLPFSSVVEKVAQEETARFLYPQENLTLIRIGGGGFSVLKLRTAGPSEFRQNHRCAAGVGSFLDQIMSRVGLNIFQVDKQVGQVRGLEVTSRCGVTMKTDFTHLLNTGHRIEEALAGLLDSSAKNAASLALKTPISPRVLIIGGLSVSQRIVETIQKNLPQEVIVEVPPKALYFEAWGAALIGTKKLKDKGSFTSQAETDFSPLVFLPGLKESLPSVTKIKSPELKKSSLVNSPVLGLDIGSTGSKAVIFDGEPVFEAYLETQGQPVQAAKDLIVQIPKRFFNQLRAIGCTGSGREIVANLFKASLSSEEHQRIFAFNEIAAHAQGASYYDKGVDTVVDIGGQDAKFTKLEPGQARMTDYCMNTVCSAGTGSFLAEQLQLLGLKDVKELGEIALESPRAVDLGQHCAIFISERIDEARRKGAKLSEIVAGLYYSIVTNYNNRVKELRDYGEKVFLQGKPAENLALACALARVTNKPIIVPSSPGSPGALGIALLAKKELDGNLAKEIPLNLTPFLKARILEKKEFRCQAKDGCLEGNLCPVQTIAVEVGKEKRRFFWGGACDKYEKVGKKQVLAQAPRPFIERENLILELLVKEPNQATKSIGLPRGLETEEILPLAITFFQELGFKVKLEESLDLKFLEEGAKLCQATFCAPLQLLAGQAKLLEEEDFLFLPKITEIPDLSPEEEKKRCYVCPLSQATPDLFSPKLSSKVLQPLLNFREGYQKNRWEFLKMGLKLGCSPMATFLAFGKAVQAQEEFEKECLRIGQKTLEFAQENQLPVVAILGHPYIINSSFLSAGIPETIQENGALALPVECYPIKDQSSLFRNIYWGYGQRLLEAAYQIRRHQGVYPLWLSVYSCGPDSFLLHFFQYLAQGKPYTILESDAYTGQAGFKTRVEAFLYGIKHYQSSQEELSPEFAHFETSTSLDEIKKSGCKVLVPWMGEGSRILMALFESAGIASQVLPLGDQENLELGRRFTSGKECLPMLVTLGGLLKYLKTHQESFYYFMPQAGGPCRFGQYQRLFKIILEKLGLAEKVKIISPNSETGYQQALKLTGAMVAKSWSALVFVDLLRDALLDLRPEEKIPGSTEAVFNRYLKKAEKVIPKTANDWSGLKDLWGLKLLAQQAASDFKKISKAKEKEGKPTVLLTGEIYVRLDSFSNNESIRELENLQAKVKLAPFREWVNYVTYLRRKKQTLVKAPRIKTYLTYWLQRIIEGKLYRIFAQGLGWPKDHQAEEILKAAEPYLRQLKPLGEAALTIGLPLLLWQKKEIAGTVVVGPFECMPTRIAETQLNLISERTGLPALALSFNGDPLDKDLLESFVWDLARREN